MWQDRQYLYDADGRLCVSIASRSQKSRMIYFLDSCPQYFLLYPKIALLKHTRHHPTPETTDTGSIHCKTVTLFKTLNIPLIICSKTGPQNNSSIKYFVHDETVKCSVIIFTFTVLNIDYVYDTKITIHGVLNGISFYVCRIKFYAILHTTLFV